MEGVVKSVLDEMICLEYLCIKDKKMSNYQWIDTEKIIHVLELYNNK